MFLAVSCKPIVITKTPHGKAKKSAKSYAPGQVKKATGSKSAKRFAPGQQKKR